MVYFVSHIVCLVSFPVSIPRDDFSDSRALLGRVRVPTREVVDSEG